MRDVVKKPEVGNIETADPRHRTAMDTQLTVHFFLGDCLDAPTVVLEDKEPSPGRARASLVEGKLNLRTPAEPLNFAGDEGVIEHPERWDDYVECVRTLPELIDAVVSTLRGKIERLEYCRDKLSRDDIMLNELGELTEAAFEEYLKNKQGCEEPEFCGHRDSPGENETRVSTKEARLRFFESVQGRKLLKQLEHERRKDHKGFYAVPGQWAFDEALEKTMSEAPGARKAHCETLRRAGYKEDFDTMSDTELAEFIGGEGFEYLVDRDEGDESES